MLCGRMGLVEGGASPPKEQRCPETEATADKHDRKNDAYRRDLLPLCNQPRNHLAAKSKRMFGNENPYSGSAGHEVRESRQGP